MEFTNGILHMEKPLGCDIGPGLKGRPQRGFKERIACRISSPVEKSTWSDLRVRFLLLKLHPLGDKKAWSMRLKELTDLIHIQCQLMIIFPLISQDPHSILWNLWPNIWGRGSIYNITNSKFSFYTTLRSMPVFLLLELVCFRSHTILAQKTFGGYNDGGLKNCWEQPKCTVLNMSCGGGGSPQNKFYSPGNTLLFSCHIVAA